MSEVADQRFLTPLISPYVIPVDETVLIARDTFRCVKNHPRA